MDLQKVLDYLGGNYPGRNIVMLPQDNPREVICELGQSANGDESTAIAFVDHSMRHHHNETVEQYEVEEGELRLFLDGQLVILREGQGITILPGTVHWAEGNATRVRVTTIPPWEPGDHLLEY